MKGEEKLEKNIMEEEKMKKHIVERRKNIKRKGGRKKFR